ncbi:hypothetical protein DDE18_16950 [Nocardioides gansuensis]|uniref:Enoyl-CoA hydratase n=1 Tax=Nocardioides gansuensis TaxID=2138300 RepID=A0A2T8F7J6_9ACTN|nr:enoyl-CoA hydratase/isomerase family protein [Nocardioides gansuensis]PVG81675.1 hypothetical protein DDE18_16950 [Nocardioides gansuensis]
MADTDHVLVTHGEGRTDVVLNRAAKLNALTRCMLQHLVAAFGSLPDETRVVVLRSSSPRAFSVGADLDEHRAQTPQEGARTSLVGSRACAMIAQSPVPVIAQIDGWCLGGGLELALACDLRVASRDSILAFPEVTLGNTPAWGGVPRLVAQAGPGRAKELLLTGRRLSAEEARELDLLEEVVDRHQLTATVDSLASTIASHPPDAVTAAKLAVAALGPAGSPLLDALGAGFFLAAGNPTRTRPINDRTQS